MLKIVNLVDWFSGATSDTITIPATTPGNVLIVLVVTQAGGLKWTAPSFISSADGNFTEVPFFSLQGGSLWDWGSFAGSGTSADVLYQVTSGGITTINFNSNLPVDSVFIREVSGLVTPVIVDDFKLIGSGASVPVVGSALTGTGINDLCYENFCTASQFMSGSNLPWLVDMGLADANEGPLFQLGVSGNQPAAVPLKFSDGTQPSDLYTCVSVAFKGVGSPPATPLDENGNPVTVKYALDDNFNLRVGRFVDTSDNIHSFPILSSNDWQGHFDYFDAPFTPGAGLGDPWGFTCIGQNYYVADQGNGILWQVNIVTGITTRIAGGGNGSGFPNEIATNWHFGFNLYTVKAGLDGNIYIGSPGFQDIICVNMKNVPITVCGVVIPVGFAAEVAGIDSGQGFRTDYSVCADANGNVYAGQEGNNTGQGNKVWRTDSAGAATLISGNGTAGETGDGGPASAATLNAPLGLAIDKNDILYIACNGNNSVGGHGTVRAINLSGIPQNVCGRTIAPGNIDTLVDVGLVSSLWAVQPDYHGNVLVCDLVRAGACFPVVSPGSRGWLHQIDAAGAYSLIAGTGTCGYTGDGGPATAALVGTAFGAAVPLPAPAPPTPNFPSPPGGDHFTPKPPLTAGPVQNIPLDNSPNQVWNVTVLVDDVPVTLSIVLRYNELAEYWVATVRDINGNVLLDSLPFVTGDGISQNLLGQFAYLGIGSATIFNASGQAA
jgi:hypothetical protein